MFALIGSIHCQAIFSAEFNLQSVVSGYYRDPVTSSVRPITGAPGAATLGPIVASDLDAVWVAPDARSALGLFQGTLFFLENINDTSTRLALTQWAGTVDQVVWSDDSNGVLVYSSERSAFRVATGLQVNPVVNPEIDIAKLGRPVVAFRLSPNTWNVSAIIGHAPQSAPRSRLPESSTRNYPRSLYLLTPEGVVSPVSGIAHPIAMDFSADGQSLYVLDKTTDQIVNIRVSAPNTTQSVLLNSTGQGASGFEDLLVSRDGTRLFTLQGKGRSVCGYEISSGNSVFCADLDAASTGLQHLSGSLYLLVSPDPDTGPLWILDAAQARDFFVPRGGPQ